jgi:hypothetical protein
MDVLAVDAKKRRRIAMQAAAQNSHVPFFGRSSHLAECQANQPVAQCFDIFGFACTRRVLSLKGGVPGPEVKFQKSHEADIPARRW